MDKLGKEFLDFLSTNPLKEARKELYNLLKTDSDEVNVYYLVSLSNLKRIVEDGGIKCRALVSGNTGDLSGQEVQKNRDKSLELVQKLSSYAGIDKKIHECINFFWNPLNNTSGAFQRRSLLIAADKDDDNRGIVCILEMRLSDFFESDKVYWSTSEKNLALSGDISIFPKNSYKNFDWQRIFSMRNDNNKYSNQFRSAEFIAFYGDSKNTNSDSIPTKFIRRILVPAQYETKIKGILPSVQTLIFPLANPKIFISKKELLKADKYLIKTLYELERLSLLLVNKFCELIDTFSNFKEQLGYNLTEDHFIINKDMAHSVHGIEHITRVIFWVHVLCYLSSIDKPTEKVAQYAAFFHDLCRKSNEEDKEHGSDVAKFYELENFLRQKQIPDDLISSCMNAVIYHCKEDRECPDKNKDLIWKILKDADSLDIGRFGHPKGYKGIRKDSNGCNVKYLRLDIFQDFQLKTNMAWLAHCVASVTRYTKWSDNTFMDIKKEIVKSLKASLRNNILNQYESQIAEEVLERLSVD